MEKTLTMDQELKVQYCIPMWLRDQQIKHAISRVKERIQPVYEDRDGPVAVACFGPSLNDTWEQIRQFRYVITCSGAHKFLVEHGIVPTWHVEVDPRAHKTKLMGPPQKETEYLIASTCHQAVFDHLEGYNVKLWHVFDSSAEAQRTLPPNEWALTGGSSVGLRALGIARFLGFTELHVFGMDGCEGKTGKHAAAHPAQPKGHQVVEYKGVQYRTTTSMLACAKQTWHELNQLGEGLKVKFYGEGLVQAMAQDYVPNPLPKERTMLGFAKPELISREYAALNEQLHRENLAYGVGGAKHAPVVLRLSETLKTKNILDYGCGKGLLGQVIPWAIAEYDPCVPGKTESPKPADIVVCTDVLEHVEPDRLQLVLADLRRCVRLVGYFVIHTGPASKTLPDGRNTHLVQRGEEWWRKNLSRFFAVGTVKKVGPELYVVVGPKQRKDQPASVSVRAATEVVG